ncbi:MAG: DUF2726 domain-containing protein [Clostridia bacterium]|nr:DUF2726 domain-containing protein [Clostridia bacterium]
MSENQTYLYNVKRSIITNREKQFFNCIKTVIPQDYVVVPQANLATFIDKTDNSKYHNELFRNVDFLITDSNYKPYVVIEINDETHNDKKRKERDEKVQKICAEAGIEIITLWTKYGVNPEYIKNRIDTALSNYPPQRVHHFSNEIVENVIETVQPLLLETVQPLPPVETPAPKKQKENRVLNGFAIAAMILSAMLFVIFFSAFVLKNEVALNGIKTTGKEYYIMAFIFAVIGFIDILKTGKALKGIVPIILLVLDTFLMFML